MTRVVKEHSGGGRILYSGCVVHHLSNGHLAPLAYFTSTPLMASSQIHDLWRYTSVFPDEYKWRGDEAIRRYLDLYNVSAVFSHERSWHDYFAARPDEYKLVWRSSPFRLYQRLHFRNNYFLEGEGDVTGQNSNSITLIMRAPQAVIKFNYFPFLTSSACEIAGRQISEHVRFIELKDCPLDTPIVIKALSPFKRLVNAK